jgi:gamma-glutamyltranspeptidase/glutathione hydrolase
MIITAVRRVGRAGLYVALSLPWLVLPLAYANVDPEAATGFVQKARVDAKTQLVVAAHPAASAAGDAMLDRGGSAVDAAIAVQLVLGLVEPQSSGLGGGLFLLHWQAEPSANSVSTSTHRTTPPQAPALSNDALLFKPTLAGHITSYDGRETAPAAAHPNWFVQPNGELLSWQQAYVGGRSVGVPGAVAALWLAHQRHGKLPWADLFTPAITLARDGFVVGPRLARLLADEWNPALKTLSPARDYFYPQGKALTAGTVVKNPAYAQLLQDIAKQGPAAFYQGNNAKAMVDTVNKAPVNAGQLTLADIANYQPLQRDVICMPYKRYQLCGMAPPSSGSLAVMQIMGILQHFDLAALPANSVQALHLLSQASRLAFADREHYLADPAFYPVPVAGLLAPAYLKARAALIDPHKDALKVSAGRPQGALDAASGKTIEFANTSHVSIVAKDGSAVSMTTSIENAFGSALMVNGYLLNNELTDFSLEAKRDGQWVANRVEAGKRPRSSMAPMMVFDEHGQLMIIAGSPGGSRIINYVAKVLVAMLEWKLDPQQAVELPHTTHRNDLLILEKNTALEGLAPVFRDRGYTVKSADLNSGLHLIKRTAQGWSAGADPRREGQAIAD